VVIYTDLIIIISSFDDSHHHHHRVGIILIIIGTGIAVDKEYGSLTLVRVLTS
jgi:hypothetical protein